MNYQKSIQVLRGIAVVAVLGYHFGIPGFGNGFLGVDVFFVISGFLMASIYQGKSITEFYMRRARRLMPAFLSTITLTVVIGYLVIIPSDFSQLVEQVTSAFLLSPNIYFWNQNSYFQSTDFNPLLNLWSLGMEFHFYLLFPLIFRLNKFSSRIFPLFFVTSLISCLAILTISPKSSFFLIPFRLWEFLFGCLVIRLKFKVVPSKKISALNNFLMLALLFVFVLMPLDGFSQTPQFGHPGVGALITVVATGLLIATTEKSLLGWSTLDDIFEWLGKYSYSLYLIHFPLLVLFNYKAFSGTNLDVDSITLLAIIIALTFFLAILQYHFIEQVFRRPIPFRKFLTYFLVLGIPLLAISAVTQEFRFTPIERNISNAFNDRPTYRCGKAYRFLHPFSNLCRLSNLDGQDKVLLFGNSHADALKDAFLDVASHQGLSVYFWAINDPLSGESQDLPAISSEISSAGIAHVYFHFSPGGADFGKLRVLIHSLNEANIRTHILGPIPVWAESVPKSLWDHVESGSVLPIQTYGDYLKDNQSEIEFLSNQLATQADYFDLAQTLCRLNCKVSDVELKPFYFDEGHLTNSGAKQLRPILRKAIAARNDFKPSQAPHTVF